MRQPIKTVQLAVELLKLSRSPGGVTVRDVERETSMSAESAQQWLREFSDNGILTAERATDTANRVGGPRMFYRLASAWGGAA